MKLTFIRHSLVILVVIVAGCLPAAFSEEAVVDAPIEVSLVRSGLNNNNNSNNTTTQTACRMPAWLPACSCTHETTFVVSHPGHCCLFLVSAVGLSFLQPALDTDEDVNLPRRARRSGGGGGGGGSKTGTKTGTGSGGTKTGTNRLPLVTPYGVYGAKDCRRNGVCNYRETCNNCRSDCKKYDNVCGDGICVAETENCITCPQDCMQDGTICCGGGSVPATNSTAAAAIIPGGCGPDFGACFQNSKKCVPDICERGRSAAPRRTGLWTIGVMLVGAIVKAFW